METNSDKVEEVEMNIHSEANGVEEVTYSNI